MHFTKTHKLRAQLMSGATLAAIVVAAPAWAQDVGGDVVVTGTRQVIQDSIKLKRQSVQIVDGLSADEIGDLPALSIGEALESITGAASHRENGGATEISIRGLGPYLSSTVVNGRAATNGSGDRSVNFSQFPSELMNKLAIFKTQDASQIEGGVAGQIQLETLKPLEYGKRRLQFDIKGNVNPDQLNQDDTQVGDIGYRGTVSYVDQFELGGLGSIGISIGGQISEISQPEAEVRSTSNTGSSTFACIVTDGAAAIGFTDSPVDTNRDCEDYRGGSDPDIGNIGVVTQIAPTGTVLDDVNFEQPIVFAPSQRAYRQNDTLDSRDSVFAAIQWRPNDRLDVNLDAQWSERSQLEQRNDLIFNGWKRNDSDLGTDIAGYDGTSLDFLEYLPSGAIIAAATDNTLEVAGEDYDRTEEYLGYGLNVAYDVNDRLTVSADYGFSETQRDEFNYQYRLQSNSTPSASYDLSTGIPQYVLAGEEFDVNDYSNFVDRLRVRYDHDLDRNNVIESGRFDVDYDVEIGAITSVQAGIRIAEQTYENLQQNGSDGTPGRISYEFRDDRSTTFNNLGFNSITTTEAENEAVLSGLFSNNDHGCRADFPEEDFLGHVKSGDLVTNLYENDVNELVSVGTSTYAAYDAQCIANYALSSLDDLGYLVSDGTSAALDPTASNSRDVTETTRAIYAMANYETELASRPLRGNFGLRVVETEVDSIGYRPDFEIEETSTGTFTVTQDGDNLKVTESHSYTEVLPSATVIMDWSDDVVLRGGVFKAISRADPGDLGFQRTIQTIGDGDEAVLRADVIAGVTGSGNPSMEPLTSWNYDLGVEIYPDADSIIALSAYYKQFNGGFVNTVQDETYNIDGVDQTYQVTVPQVFDDESTLYGFEFTGTHSFSYLPGRWSGLGVKVSYNYADSDFEFNDSLYGDRFQVQDDGTLLQTHEGIIPTGDLPGLSNHTFSSTLYYQIGGLDLSAIYKYRDEYFQPFTSNGTRLRYVGEVGVWEARAAYEINDNYRVSVEAINLFSEEKRQYRFVNDDLYEVNSYGPRIFFGLRGRF